MNTCLITGLPGSGKTLYAIEMILNNSKLENPRPVFTNIKGIDHEKLGTKPLGDPQAITPDSHPAGSVFVIDEAQDCGYHNLPSTKRKPPHITIFETRRHYGYDYVIITQHPKLIDKHLRVLLADHYHCVRPFGLKYRNIFHWPSVNEEPEPRHSASNANITKKFFNKKLYGYYKSATVHTQKINFPKKPLVILGCMAIVAAIGSYFGYGAYKNFYFKGEAEGAPVAATESSGEVLARSTGSLVERAEYSGFMVRRRSGIVNLDVFFNFNDETLNLRDYDYYLEQKHVFVLTKTGSVFTVFEIDEYDYPDIAGLI